MNVFAAWRSNAPFPMKSLLLAALSALLAASASADEVQGVILPFKQVSLSSPVAQDVIDSVLVEEGQSVKEGQVVVQLRKAIEELAVQEAAKIKENDDFKAKGYGELAKSNMASRDIALQAQTQAELDAIRLAAKQQDLREKTIRSTLNGIVTKKYKEAGEGVDRVEKLVDIIDIDSVFAQFYISPKLLPTVHLKDPVTIHVADLNGASFTGNIDFISPSLDAGSGLVRVKVLIQNPDHKMKANMKASADFAKGK